jgi:hypothetical protein
MTSRTKRWLTLALTVGSLGVFGCSSGGGGKDSGAIGGAASTGGATGTGGNTDTGGTTRAGGTTTGGTTGTGGATGGTADTGGTTRTGGTAGTGGTGGTAGTGGTTGTGGTIRTGGTTTGGTTGTGGTIRTGGTTTGGTTGTGGTTRTGGTTTGGTAGTGGTIRTGGTTTGGTTGTGGTTRTGGASTGGVATGGAAGGTPASSGGSGGMGSIVVPIQPGEPGNPDGQCPIPLDGQLEDVSSPTTVVGTGTQASCTPEAFIAAVAAGGIITFNCGPDPATITLTKPAKVFNDKGPKIVIDGGGKVILSGGGTTRILYMNTCDENQVWTTSHCQDQDTPQLTVQNLTFANANSKTETTYDGGGAIWVRGGRFKVINSRFMNNVCADSGPDVGGGGIRVFSQFSNLPVYVVNSTFGGSDGVGNVCSNGGGISSIGVSWTILNSLFSYNRAIGNGGNPATSGTPGGGSGGAIYNDGNTMTLSLCGTRIEYNQVVAFGSAIFFVSNDHTGDIKIDKSTITNNIGGSWYPTYPQISGHADTPIVVTNSTIQ